MLIGVSLADAAGERRPQNMPGTVDEYPNWRIPLTDSDGKPVLLEDLPGPRGNPRRRGRRVRRPAPLGCPGGPSGRNAVRGAPPAGRAPGANCADYVLG
jgi:hypothetical protein